ncbi:MAG: glycosyltransferase [Gammaproteobacteria bacterium]|nr:glycosyltransferase [Gammaproteobacteria bacterium]
MNICQVICSAGHGGLERHFADLCNGLSQRHKVVALAPSGYQGRLVPAVDYRALPLDSWRYNPVALLRLLAEIRRCEPDIVHAQANKATSMVGSLARWISAKRVATIHNQRRNVMMFAGYDHVIAVGQQAAAQITGSPVSVVFNGIAASREMVTRNPAVLRKRFSIDDPRPLVIALGRMVPAKGFDVLLEAWRGIDACLLLIGDGPQRSLLEKQANDLGLRGNVRFVGYCADAAQLLWHADLLVISSRNEGFPYVLVEALHARQVVISTSVSGALDVLPAEYRVSCGSAAALHDKVQWALDNIELLRKMYEPVWLMAHQELTIESMVGRTGAIYQGLLEG